jgi:phosphohistidine phosphatase SixA
MTTHRRPGLALAAIGLSFIALLAACDRHQPPKPAPHRPAPANTQSAPAPAPAEEPPPAPAPTFGTFGSAGAAASALHAGGYILCLRHGKTDQGVQDTQGTNFDDCSRQRNLSAEGREQAAQLGKQFAGAKVPIGDVLSSPFCRNKDTAQLAFGRFTLDPAIIGDTPDAVAKLRTLLGTPPPAGKNTVIISHQKAMTACTGDDLYLFVEGATLVMKPRADGTSEMVATIQPEDWPLLVEAAGKLP